jgi:AsmA family protein
MLQPTGAGPRFQEMSMSNRRALAWAGGSLAVIIAAIAAGEVMGWPFLRQPLQDAATRSAAVPIVLDGPLRVHFLFRPRLSIEHLSIAPGGGAQVPHLLDARGVELSWRWADVWRWRQGAPLRVQALHAAQLEAWLVRGADGRASWQLGRPDAARAPTQDTQTALAGVPRFGELRLEGGRIQVDDVPLKTRLQIDIRGGEGDALPDGTRAGYEATVAGRWQALPMQLQVRTGGSLPLVQDEDAAGRTPAVALRVEGTAGAARLLFDGTAGALLGDRQLKGKLRFSGPSLARVGEPLGLTLPQTQPFDLTGELAHDAGVWQLRADRATIGRSQLEGDFRYDSRTTPGRLSGRLGGQRLALADLGPSVGAAAPGTPPPAAAKATGRVLPQRRFDLPSLRAMDADVQVAVRELDFGSVAITPLQNLKTRVLLQAGVLELQGLQASVAGGQFAGSTRLDATAELARWAVDVRFTTVDIAGWLPGLRTQQGRDDARPRPNAQGMKAQRDRARQGGAQPVISYVTGSLGGSLQATGRGNSTGQILSTLDGRAQFTLRDGTISHLLTEAAGLDLAQALGVLIQRDRPLPLRCARVDLLVQDGIVRTRQAVLDNKDSTVRVSGQINLHDETLALRAQTRPKDFSPLSLRTPITVTGTLGAPQVGIEGKRLAGKVLGALALGMAIGPAAALLPLVDTGSEEEKRDPCDPLPLQELASKASAPAQVR